MKVIFFGTPDYVLPVLSALHNKYNRGLEKKLVGVVTQPPRPVGREKKITHSPVDEFAFKRKIPIFTESWELPEAELGVCASFGEIIPGRTIEKFKYGILNIHPSLLPEYRGASPIQAAMVAGEKETGVSVIKMDEKMDHGPIVSVFKEKINEDDTAESLRTRLFERSAEFLMELIPNYVNNKTKLKEQEHKKASYTKIIKKKDGFIEPRFVKAAMNGKKIEEKWKIEFIKDYEQRVKAETVERFVRAMWPWPVAWTLVNNKRLKILKAHVQGERLVLDKVQIEGKNPVSWRQFMEGYPEAKFD